MSTWPEFTESFVRVYEPLAQAFATGVSDTDPEGLPEPFFPVAGRNYPSAETKIVFVGMETRTWGDLNNFLTEVRESPAKAIFREQDEFDECAFTGWSSNSGKDFWSFVLKFLAGFHRIEDWKALKRSEYPEILSSFGWANVNCIERHHVSSEKRGARFDNWQAVKKASLIVDDGEHMLRAFAPHLVIVTHWNCDERWLTGQRTVQERTEVADHLLYLRLFPGDIHVIWTAHPRWLAFRGFDHHVRRCVELAKSMLSPLK